MQSDERGYAIIGTPRSGTSHLCRLLTSTGIMGKPAEYLHPSHSASVTGPAATVPGDTWASIKAISRTDNGVYAIKAFYDHFRRFEGENIHRMVLALPLVLVTRNDKIGQAISLVRAMQTRQWSSESEASKDPHYDAMAIRNCLDRILVHETTFRQAIALHGLPALFVTYEEYVEQPLRTLRAIGALVGVDGFDTPLQSSLKIQRDSLNAVWRDRFIAEQGPLVDLPMFRLNDRWSRVGRRLRRIKRRLPFAVRYDDYVE